jgi:hypothetical protein
MTTPGIGELLAHEAALAEEAETDTGGTYVRSRRRPKDPAQVYSLRVPVDRLDLVRQLAEQENTTQAALLRKWVLERLDQELARTRGATITPDNERLLALVEEIRAAIMQRSQAGSAPPRAARRSTRRKSA